MHVLRKNSWLIALIWGSHSLLSADTHIKELKLNCHGSYEVLESKAYFIPEKGRAPSRAGTHESVKVLSLEGEGCEALEASYGIAVSPGDVIGYGVPIPGGSFEQAKALAQSRIGKSFPFQATQTFRYQTSSGHLPFFPTVHSETVHVLSLTGQADVKQLYGTPELSQLSSQQLYGLLQEAYGAIGYGKMFQGTSIISNDFLSFILQAELKDEEYIKEYIGDSSLLFKNTSLFTSSFVTLHPGTQIGKKLNQLLNTHGGSKFLSKLEVLKRNPLLFEDQIIGWAFLEKGMSVPKLSESELLEFLQHSLEQAYNLSKVPQVLEARYLLSQYKEAAKSILSYSPKQAQAQYPKPEYFPVNAEAENLIKEILSIK